MKLLLVTGAGASHMLSVDPKRPLPLMDTWATRLRADIGGGVANMIGLTAGKSGVEFEETLGALFQWFETLPQSERFAGMARPAPDDDDIWPGQFRRALGHITDHMDRFTHQLHRSLFDEFGPRRIAVDTAVLVYEKLFGFIMGDGAMQHHQLVCATTNYDRSLELALERLVRLPRTGFSAHSVHTPVLEPHDLGEFRDDDPALLYLHGAVGWYRTNDNTIVSMGADQPYNPSLGQPAVLYPGPDKEIARTETFQLWQEFERVVNDASHVLVLGHGLNDRHLVDALRKATGKVAVTFYSPSGTSNPPASINERLPDATPIHIDFGPNLQKDKALNHWAT